MDGRKRRTLGTTTLAVSLLGAGGEARLPAALQFPLAHPAVVSLVVGRQSPSQVRANLDLLAEPIPAAIWAEPQRTGLLPEHAPLPAG